MKKFDRTPERKPVITDSITRPMKAAVVHDIDQLEYPLWGQPKLDGIRCLKIEGQLLSASFKPIPNEYINEVLTSMVPNGFDGELVLAGNRPFNEVSSAVMSKKGEPDFEYHVFDYVINNTRLEFWRRREDLKYWFKNPCFGGGVVPTKGELRLVRDYVKQVKSKSLLNAVDLRTYEQQMLAEGHEGIMLRCPVGPYKSGVSTLKQQYLLKLKRFQDAEAVVVGFEEQCTNTNAMVRDELGRAKRSTAKAGRFGTGLLGALVVEDRSSLWRNERFRVGGGFTDAQRREIWEDRDSFMGRLVKYKYQDHGTKDAPRHPTFIGWRHIWDTTIGCMAVVGVNPSTEKGTEKKCKERTKTK
jgi:DNA ligase-1